jgi:hypothetical protein
LHWLNNVSSLFLSMVVDANAVGKYTNDREEN